MTQLDETLPALFRHSILAAQRSSHRVLADMIRAEGLTPAWSEVLTVLDERGALTIRQLSNYLVCEADHPSRLISRMESKGLIGRKPHPDDKRAVLLTLTDTGQKAAETVKAIEARFDAWLAQTLSAGDMDQVVRTFQRILKGTAEGESLAARFTT